MCTMKINFDLHTPNTHAENGDLEKFTEEFHKIGVHLLK